MKKLISVVIAVCLGLSCVSALSACKRGDGGEQHTHTPVYHAAKAPDCTNAGWEEYWECTVCHAFFADEALTKPYDRIPSLPARGHAWSEWSVKTPATCAEAGEEVRECTFCNKEETRTVSATGSHIWNDAYACSVCGAINETKGLEFAETDDLLGGSYALTDTGGNGGVIVLPAAYNGKPVTRIKAGAVGEGVTRVVIPANGCIFFESGAIAAADVEICFRGTADEWAGYVFESGWNNGAALYLLNSEKSGFEKATSLILRAERISAYAFMFLGVSDIVLGKNAEYVGAYAFAESGVRSANLGNIAVLGAYAFYGCRSLEEIVLSERLPAVNTGCFAFCSSLKTLRLPAGIRSVGANAFAGCEFASVTYGGTQEQWERVEISDIGNEPLDIMDFSGRMET